MLGGVLEDVLGGVFFRGKNAPVGELLLGEVAPGGGEILDELLDELLGVLGDLLILLFLYK
jgi:hypothetical protein